MNEQVDLEAIRKRLSALKYPQLRKAAKRHSIYPNQKKEVLVTELSKIWGHPYEFDKENITPKKPKKAPSVEVRKPQSPKNPLSETLNQTFTVEGSNESDDVCRKEEGDTEKMNILRFSEDMAFMPASTGIVCLEKKNTDSSRKDRFAQGTISARFAAIHQKLVEKQPTLREVDANLKKKFAEHEKAVPGVFKRLATPKAVKISGLKKETKSAAAGYNFKNANADPARLNFSFSRIYGATSTPAVEQINSNAEVQTRIPRLRKQREPRLDVKQITKNLRTKQVRRSPRLAKLPKRNESASVLKLSTRLRRLATPRGKDPDVSLTESEKATLRKCGRRYTPRRGPLVPFVDTTKMTDMQFHKARSQGQVQTLTAVSTLKVGMQQQVCQKRREARERVLREKRGF